MDGTSNPTRILKEKAFDETDGDGPFVRTLHTWRTPSLLARFYWREIYLSSSGALKGDKVFELSWREICLQILPFQPAKTAVLLRSRSEWRFPLAPVAKKEGGFRRLYIHACSHT